MSYHLFSVELIKNTVGIPVFRFNLNHGGWGTRNFRVFPNSVPTLNPLGGSSWLTLGIPRVVTWIGSEFGSSGYGLAIRIGGPIEWKSWYVSISSHSTGSLKVGADELEKINIRNVFSVEVSSKEVIVLKTNNKIGSMSDLVSPLSSDLLDITNKYLAELKLTAAQKVGINKLICCLNNIYNSEKQA
jgi:hypothetical protein